MDYGQSGEVAPPVEHLHPALQESDESGAKRQRLDGDAAGLEGAEQQPGSLAAQVRCYFAFACRAREVVVLSITTSLDRDHFPMWPGSLIAGHAGGAGAARRRAGL